MRRANEDDASLLQRVVRRHGVERTLGLLNPEQQRALPYIWPIVARPKQRAPKLATNKKPWRWWLLQAGRGFGKTRSAAEWVREKVKRMPGSLGALIGQTPDDVRLIQIEGPSGLLAITPADERPVWEPAKGKLTWPNGTVAMVFSGANPGELRGPQFHWAWVDELAKFAKAKELFDMLSMALRLEFLGAKEECDRQPQCCISTTPRPISVLRDLAKRSNCVVTRGSTYENRANLASSFISEMLEAYEGTRLGDQELFGKLLDDVPGALWQRAWFERPGFRVKRRDDLRIFDLIVVAIDPAVSNADTADETGIVVVGMWRDERGRRKYHVIDDRSIYGTAQQRAHAAIVALADYEANGFVVETNNGGDWIPAVIRAEWAAMQAEDAWRTKLAGQAPVHVVTATRGKHVRAEPISTLYEQLATFSHEPGLEVLEDQLVTWSPLLAEKSPDRLDALVWGATYLSTAKVVVLT